MVPRLLVFALALTAGLPAAVSSPAGAMQGGVASVPASPTPAGAAPAPTSPTPAGDTSVPTSPTQAGVASVPASPAQDGADNTLIAANASSDDAATPGGPAATNASALVGVYPDPVTDEDRGEFVVVDLVRPGPWTLSDGETEIRVPATAVGRGPVAIAADPEVARAVTAVPVVTVTDSLALANAGERITLARDGTVVDDLAYPGGSQAEYWDGDAWRVPGRTAFPATVARDAPVETFVLPDDTTPVIDALRDADERILLAGYTFSSPRVARALRNAAARNVTVRVLVEGGPVGGMSDAQVATLDSLAGSGIPVTAIDGPRARYSFHHAKYAVVDDRALVTSENWKRSGVGGRANRGWGAVVDSPRLAAHLARTFRADATWLDGRAWRDRGRDAAPATPSGHSFPRRFAPASTRAEAARVVLAPDNADAAVRRLVGSANGSLYVEQVRIEPGHPFLDAAIAAARRGVRVRILVSGAWYVREDNRNLTRRLNRLAAREDIPLEARVVRPRSRFEKVHVKGVVVDGERALVGSLNWNTNAVEENREVALVLRGDRVGTYYERAFLADWRGGAWRISAGLLLVVGTAVLSVMLAGRRVEFEDTGS